MWSILKKHPVAVGAAVFAHILFFSALFFNFDFSSESKTLGGKTKEIEFISAKTIDEKTLQARKDKKQREANRKKEVAKKAKEAKLKLQREKEQKIKQAEKKKQQVAEKKRLAELEKKRQADKKKQLELKKKEAELKKQEEIRKQKEEKQKQEQKRKEEEAQAELDLKNKMQADRVAREKAASARQSEIKKYEGLIKTAVERHWKVPSAANKELKCVIQVSIIPSGDVINVETIKSSGNAAFDKSVENAAYRASPLPVPAAETGNFEHFRKINFEFSPRNRI